MSGCKQGRPDPYGSPQSLSPLQNHRSSPWINAATRAIREAFNKAKCMAASSSMGGIHIRPEMFSLSLSGNRPENLPSQPGQYQPFTARYLCYLNKTGSWRFCLSISALSVAAISADQWYEERQITLPHHPPYSIVTGDKMQMRVR